MFGIYCRSNEGVVAETYHVLYALQHRGQECCGIAVNNNGVITCHKDVGLVTDVLTLDVLEKLPDGRMEVGHCLYGSAVAKTRDNAQPLLINHFKDAMALCLCPCPRRGPHVLLRRLDQPFRRVRQVHRAADQARGVRRHHRPRLDRRGP